MDPQCPVTASFFTDHSAILGAKDEVKNINQSDSLSEMMNIINNDISIYISEFEEAVQQNDQQGWLDLYQVWVNKWLSPALEMVEQRKILSVNLLVGDGYCYQYGAMSRFCFWRKHRLKASVD